MTAKLTILHADISQLQVDGIVNAANASLNGGGGVDGAIHRAAGPQLLQACRQLHGCATGEAVITPGFDLPAKYVIHTVGPVYQPGDTQQAGLLANCYRNSLLLAAQHQLRTVAFPAISCGAYGYPLQDACNIAIGSITETLAGLPDIRKVILTAMDDEVYQAWVNALQHHGSH